MQKGQAAGCAGGVGQGQILTDVRGRQDQKREGDTRSVRLFEKTFKKCGQTERNRQRKASGDQHPHQGSGVQREDGISRIWLCAGAQEETVATC